MYKANRSNASWEWLAMISPCIAVLRKLAEQMNSVLGEPLGTKHHTPEWHHDLMTMHNSMCKHSVFHMCAGYVLCGIKEPEVPNVIAAGLKQLTNPLTEYNKTFQQLQQHRCELLITAPTVTNADEGHNPAAPDALFIMQEPLIGVGA